MPISTETMEVRFKKKFTYLGRNQIDQQEWLLNPSTKPYEIMDFIQSELSISQNRILEELERMKMKWKRTILWKEHYKSGYNQALQDIIKLISKKDNQSTLTKGN